MDETTPLLADSSLTNRQRLLAKHKPIYGSGATSREIVSQVNDESYSNLNQGYEDLSPTENFQEAEEIPLEELVKGLCSAWQRSRCPKAKIDLDFFTPWELLSMHVAWKRLTRGKRCIFETHTIAEALAHAIALVIFPESPFPPDHLSFVSWNLAFHADKNLLAANLLREWKRITEGVGLDSFTLSQDSGHQQSGETPLVGGFRQRLAQLWNFILLVLLHFRFRITMHISLIIWPIYNLTLGTKYLYCPIAHPHLLYLLMILGSIGCLAVSVRVGLMLLTSGCPDPESWCNGWHVLRWIESGFLIVFLVQAGIFFSTKQPFGPGLHHCVKNFYRKNLASNYVSIALLSVYLVVYLTKICLSRSRT